MGDKAIFFRQDEMEWEAVEDKIERQIVGYDDTMMMVNVKFEKGGVGSVHHHVHTQSTYISEGKFEVTVADDKKVLKKGDSFFVPSNTPHGVVCLESGVLIDVFTPVRKDFLK
ncbi:cupin domain-containing protein [Aestuariivivens sediminicola]|uniref:cupin domain-containing protein n=1 Tax=Aestuariivivens sediminicola TaxID=2913560 RepID=UPI001F5739A1|nr:cupin domain-containing protein [Aestuariivivens sediminicola]